MSTTIDNRIVEMEFDNAQFEKGIRTSLKSLEDLKKGLDLDKAVSSLSNLERAANKFDLSGIQNAVESLQNRFSTLGVIGITALENITNKAIDAGTALMKSLSVDQIASGMSKYEAETQAIATMRYALPDGMTEEGTGKIYDAIEKLQKYSDETSYSFSTMVDNMGKFIAAGVDLKTAEKSMEGIANWAAMSGTSAQSANFARVMYNLSQAMGSGNVKLMDWMSIENANMATAGFKKQVIETAKEMGKIVEVEGQLYAAGVKLTDANKENHKITAENMRNTLSDGWFTADVLNEVLKVYAESEEAFKAAQQARTFTDAIEAAKDAVSTGWARSFRLIFGDINQATEYFTDLANAIISVTDMVAGFRNGILEVWSNFGGRNELVEAFWNIWNILRGIGRSMLEAFGLTSAGLVEKLGKGLYEVTHRFNEATAAILSLFDAYKVLTGGSVEKKTTKTTKTISGDLADLQKHARESEAAVRGMINTGTVKMKPQTVETFTALADAYKELDEYLASGTVTSEGLAERLAKINELNEKAGKTNKLMKWKQKALKAMRGELDAYKDVSAETIATTNETTTEMTEAEEEIYYHSARLKEIFKGLKDFFGLFVDTISGVKGEISKFARLFTPLFKPALNLTSAFAALVSHIRETGVVSDSIKGWVSQILNAFSPLTDKISVVVGWFQTLQKAIYDRDYGKRAFFDDSSMKFLTGPIGERIKNIAGGIQSAINIVVRVLSAAINVVSTFVSTFIMPLVGPTAMAVLDFFSGLGKAIMGLDSGMGSLDTITAISNQIKDFLTTIRDNIVASPIFQRAKTILTSFFKIFSMNPTAAINYLKAVSRGLLEPVKNSELYKSASSKLKSFGKGILNTVRNSKGLTKARRYAELFFNVFKKDPKKGMKMLKSFGKQLIQSITGSKPMQALNSFRQDVSDFFSKLFPKNESDKTKSAAARFMTNFGKVFEDKGLGGALEFAKTSIIKKLSEWSRAFSESPIGQKAIAFKNSLVQTFNNLKAELQENELVQRFLNFFARLQAAFDENGIAGVIDTLKETFIRKFNELKQTLVQNEIVQKAIALKNSLKQAFADFSEKIGLGEKIEKIKKWFADLKKTFEEKGPITALTKFKNTVVQKFTTLMSGISVQSIIQKIQSLFSQIKESIKNANVGAAFDELKKTIVEKIKGLFPSPSEALEGEEGGGIVERIKAIFEHIKEQLAGAIPGFISWMKEKLSGVNLVPIAKNLVKAFLVFKGLQTAGGIGTLFGSLGKAVQGMLGKKSLGERALEAVDSLSKNMLMIAGAVAILITAMGVLAKMDSRTIKLGLQRLALVMVELAVFLNVTRGTSVSAFGLIGIAVSVLLLCRAIERLSTMKPGKMKRGLKGLAGVLLELGIFMRIASGQGFTKSLGLIFVANSIGKLIDQLDIIGSMDPEKLKQGLIGLGAVLLEFGIFLRLAGTGMSFGSSMASLLLMAGFLYGFVKALQEISDIPQDQIMAFAKGLSAFILSLDATILVLGNMPISAGATAAANLIEFLGIFGGVTAALGALTEQFPQIDQWLEKGGETMGRIGNAIGLLLHGLIEGVKGNKPEDAVNSVDDLSGLGTNLKSFSETVDGIKTEAVEAASNALGYLADAAKKIPNQGGLLGRIFGENDADTFGKMLPALGEGLADFSSKVSSGIDTEAISAACTAITSIAGAADKIPNEGGWIAKLIGDNSAGTWGKELPILGSGLIRFYNSTKGVDPTSVTNAATAISNLANAAEEIPNEGGWIAKLVGENTIDVWGKQLPILGSGLVRFYNSTKGIDSSVMSSIASAIQSLAISSQEIPNEGGWIAKFLGDNTVDVWGQKLPQLGSGLIRFYNSTKGIDGTVLEGVAKGIQALAISNQEIPNEGGWIAKFLGDNTVDVWGQKLPQLGSGLIRFYNSTKGIDGTVLEGVAKGIQALAISNQEIPENGGWIAKLLGDNSIDVWAQKLPSLGSSLIRFYNSTKSINATSFSEITSVINTFISFSQRLLNGSYSLAGFGEDVAGLGTQLATFTANLRGFDYTTVAAATTVLKDLMDLAISNKGITSEDLTQSVINIIQTLDQFSGNEQFGHGLNELATNMVNGFADTLRSGSDQVKIQGGYLGQAARDGAASWINDFDTVGYNMSIGLANGITSGIYQVTSAAYSVGAAALGAAQAAVNSHSPSLKFMELGMFMDEGLAIGLTSYAGMVREAAGDSAESALTETASVVAKVSSMLAQGVDETPTIRPVLDLTDITTGVAAMNGMLPGAYGMRVNGIMPTLSTARANAISENQPTAGSADVVNAVNSLAARLDLLEETMSSLNVVLDTGATVGGLAPAMNKEFGSQSLLDERNI